MAKDNEEKVRLVEVKRDEKRAEFSEGLNESITHTRLDALGKVPTTRPKTQRQSDQQQSSSINTPTNQQCAQSQTTQQGKGDSSSE
jgi:hypothetical protein